MNIKYTTKQLNIYYAKVFLNCNEEELAPTEYFAHLMTRFNKEAGYNIERKGITGAVAEWLSGLATNIPYRNDEIEDMLKETGYFPDNEDKQWDMIQGYWLFMARKLVWLSSRKDKWFTDNIGSL